MSAPKPTTPLVVERDSRVLRVRLNRPEKRNALNAELCEKIAEAIEHAAGDSRIGAILLEAVGDVFCAGMDLDEATQPDAAERTAIHQRLFTMGARAAKPIVAAVRGPALGGGVGLIANAHVVIAAQGTTFGLTEIRIGMWPFVIFPAMALAVGERRVLELALTGRIFGANEAATYGLVHEVAPRVELEDRAEATAHMIANWSPEALLAGMDYIRRRREMPAAEALELGATLRAGLFRGEDWMEGVRAFWEKRKPEWPSLHKKQ